MISIELKPDNDIDRVDCFMRRPGAKKDNGEKKLSWHVTGRPQILTSPELAGGADIYILLHHRACSSSSPDHLKSNCSGP